MATPLTLGVVFRVVATVVAVAMLSTSGSAALQHVHAYADHDHAGHHHGLAAHVHGAPGALGHQTVDHSDHPGSKDFDHGARLEGCDPGAHAVSIVFTYVAPQPEHPPVPVTVDAVVVAPPEQALCHVASSDARVHSPPRLTDAPLRAPPVVRLA